MVHETGIPNSRPAEDVLHPLVVRITHRVNAIAIIIMIGNGWRIYNQEVMFGFTSALKFTR
jgi:thiosulfate reductase cytochrome b subunit